MALTARAALDDGKKDTGAVTGRIIGRIIGVTKGSELEAYRKS